MVVMALAAGALTAVTSQSASAVSAVDTQLVVTDVTSADSQNLSAVSLKTFNIDKTKSFTKPVELPIADAGSDKAFTLSGDSNGNGSLSRSDDKNYLAVAGYNKVPGTTGVAEPDPKKTTSAQIGRMVARISSTGTVDTSTLLGPNVFNASAPRGAASVNGSSFFVSGNGGTAPDSPVSGVIKVNLGGDTNNTKIAPTTQKNVRQIQIAGGELYATSDKTSIFGLGKFTPAGGGLPTTTSAITKLAQITTVSSAPKPQSDSYVPDALLMLHTGATGSAIDTAYVVVDADSSLIPAFAGEIRKYTLSGGTWTLNGTKTGDYPFLTGRLNAAGNAVQLYAAKSSAAGNTLVSFDDSNTSGAASFGSETTLATAAAGHAFRGVAFAPTSWNPGTISSNAPTASVVNSTVGGTFGDAHNPTTALTLADGDTDPAGLTVTAHSSNQGVIPDANVTVDGTGLTRTVSYMPTGRGRSTITFTVTDDNANTGSAQVAYGASNAPVLSSGHYLYESSDLSSAVDVGNDYSLAISSEDNSIRLYKQGESGRPVYTHDFDPEIGSSTADIEGMARVNDMLYILGSHGNNSDGALKPARRVLFTAAVSGSGASTTVTYVGKFTGLWDDLRIWDQSHGNRLGFAAGQADGKKANDPDGFNIEGLEFAPNSTSTAYLGFRSPLVAHAGKPSAVIVPVTNADNLILGTASNAIFGEPIYLDLGGRTIRDIRKNSHNEYLISAQSTTGSPNWALYAWDGNPNNNPIKVKDLPDPASTTTGSWESIVSVPHPLAAGGSVSLIADSGDTTYYGDVTVGSDESKGLRKSYADDFTTSSFVAVPATPANVSTTLGPGSIGVSWNAVSGADSYNVTVKDGDTNAPGSPKSVTSGTSATFGDLDPTKSYTITVTAVNVWGEGNPSGPVNATPGEVPVANTTPPSITGTLKVGSTLTADDGEWTPSGTTYAYAWSAAGTPIGGATSKTYELTSAEASKKITVRVTASKTGYGPTSATSAQTAEVTDGLVSNETLPSISGTAQVGSTLTADDGEWTPSGTTYSYAWSADGSPIGGANSKTFTPTADEVGKSITVTVSASKAGYTPAAAPSPQTSEVAEGTISNTALPSISGALSVGSTLTAGNGEWTPSGTTYAYAWSADGTPIDGATSKTYDLTSAELGKTISVKVTASKAGYASETAASASTSEIAIEAIANTALPTISGTPKVGSTLTADDGEWTPSGTTYSYAWSADGTPIDGATSKTLDLTAAEQGKTIKVAVTASKTDLTPVTANSAPTVAVASGTIANTDVPTISGTARSGQTLTATHGAWTPSGTNYDYAWLADGTTIGGATTDTFDLTPAEVGKKITVAVTASKDGYTSTTSTSAATETVDPSAVSNSVPPSIGTAAVVGQTLTALKGTWAPATGVTFAYQWLADGAEIDGATSSTFTPTASQTGKKISVKVTGSKPGLTSLDKTSAETSAVTNTPPPFGPPTNFISTTRTSSTITLTWTKSTDATHYRIYSGIGTGTRTKLEVGNVSTATITGLKPSTGYSIDISAFKADGTQSNYTRPRLLVSTSALQKPTNLVATQRTATSISISWTKVPGVKNYRIYSGIGTGTRTKLEVGDVSVATIIGLKRGQTYSIDMASLSADKTLVSPYTPRISQATSSLLAPTKFASTGHTPTTVSLKWVKATGAESYRIYYGIGTGPRTRVDVGDVSSVTIPGLVKGKTYLIDIASIEDSGNSRSSYSPRISVKTG
ncbi:MAG: fibronectin type III domain-containing protein [Actinomycetota bacterium]|nr:fibronectin type III domain-containing protein [Actinomycetota bacterium]